MEEISLKQVLKTIYKNRKILICIVIATILFGMIYSFIIIRPEYRSTSKVLINSNDASIKEFIKSQSMIQKVSQAIGNSKVNSTFIEERVIVSFDTATKLISISSVTNDKNLSCSIAQSYINVLKTELENIYDIKTFTIIEEPMEASMPSNIHHKKDIMTFGIIGVIIAVLYIAVTFLFNNKTINSSIIEENIGIKVIGKLNKEKKSKKVIDYFMHDTVNLNKLNKMAVTIQMANKNKKTKSILITGAEIGVGSTYVTTNLANTYAKLGYRVLVLDANKSGIQNKIFNTTINEGFSDLVLNVRNIDIENLNIDEYIANTPIDGISIMSYGTENLNEKMLISKKTTQMFNKFATLYDIILIDAPTMKKDVTTLILSSFVDSRIVVAEFEKTKLDDIEEIKESLQNIEQEINGIILNKIEN